MALDSLEDLRVFRQIVHSGGISAAARALRTTKNRVSQRLAALEASLGVALAIRTTRAFRLTEEGSRLFDASDALVAAAAIAELAVASEPLAGRVRVAVRSAIASTELAAALVRASDEAPRVELEVVVVDEGADILAQGFDLAVVVGKLPDSDLVATRLASVHYAMCAHPSYLDRFGRPRSPEQLSAHRCVRKLSDARETHWTLVGPDGRRVRAPLDKGIECSDARLQTALIYSGYGIGLRPIGELSRAGSSIEQVLPGFTIAPISVWCVGPKARRELARVRYVVELLRGVVETQSSPPLSRSAPSGSARARSRARP